MGWSVEMGMVRKLFEEKSRGEEVIRADRKSISESSVAFQKRPIRSPFPIMKQGDTRECAKDIILR